MFSKSLQGWGLRIHRDYIISENGDIDLDLSKMTREQAAAIEVTVDQYTHRGRPRRNGNGFQSVSKRTRFKLADKQGALALLGKHLKLFTELHHQTGSITLAERMKRADEEAGDE